MTGIQKQPVVVIIDHSGRVIILEWFFFFIFEVIDLWCILQKPMPVDNNISFPRAYIQSGLYYCVTLTVVLYTGPFAPRLKVLINSQTLAAFI